MITTSSNHATEMTIEDQQAKIQQFLDLYQQGKDCFVRAGEVIVQLVECDPHVFTYIIQKNPLLTPAILQTFERIGRGQILPSLAMDNSPGGNRLKMCPLSVQKRFETEPIPLLVSKPNGDDDVMLVPYRNLSRTQSFQVIVDGRVATIDEQKARMAHVWQKNAKHPVIGLPWRIKGNRAVFIRGAALNADELQTILDQLSK